MNDPARLKRLLNDRPILMARAEGKVSLIGEGGAMKRMLETPKACAMINVAQCLPYIVRLVGDRVEFTRTDIAKVAGIHPLTAYEWINEGIITPSIREAEPGIAALFSFADIFAAGVCGSLSRQGMPRRTLKNVQRHFTTTTTSSTSTN